MVRTERGRGIGTALLRAALDDARRSGVAHVYAKADSRDDPDAATFLGRHGFAHATRMLTVEGDIEVLHESLRSTLERLTVRGRRPAESRIVSFPDAPRGELARLYAEHIAHQPEMAARIAAPSASDTLIAASPVAMVGGDVAGFVLWSREGQVAHVHAKVVAPAFRGRWTNAVLMGEAIARWTAAGLARVRFEVLSTNADTLKLARRFRADTIGTQDVYRLDLEPPRA